MMVSIDIDELQDLMTDLELYPVTAQIDGDNVIHVQGTDNEGNPINYKIVLV